MNIPLFAGIVGVLIPIGGFIWVYFIQNTPVKIRFRMVDNCTMQWLIVRHDLLLAEATYDSDRKLTKFEVYPGPHQLPITDGQDGWAMLLKDLGFEHFIPAWWPHWLPPKLLTAETYLIMNSKRYDRMLELLFEEDDAKTEQRS